MADLRTAKKTKRVIVFRPSLFERTHGNSLLKRFDHCTLIFGGTPKNNVFLGYFPEHNRYRDEIRNFKGHIWTSYITDVKYSCCRRLTDLSEEYSFELE
jgi:hypothetical protein